jgi:sulfite reductase (NADPH) flavoprotein alpha-component
LSLAEALQWHFELTVNTGNIVENYATLTRSETLLPLVGDKAQLQHYAATTPIVDMVRFSPAQLDAQALVDLLRPLTPRLYSIASSQAEVESEVHVTVGVVRYEIEGRARAGGAPVSSPTAWKKKVKFACSLNTTTISACRQTRRRR